MVAVKSHSYVSNVYVKLGKVVFEDQNPKDLMVNNGKRKARERGASRCLGVLYRSKGTKCNIILQLSLLHRKICVEKPPECKHKCPPMLQRMWF